MNTTCEHGNTITHYQMYIYGCDVCDRDLRAQHEREDEDILRFAHLYASSSVMGCESDLEDEISADFHQRVYEQYEEEEKLQIATYGIDPHYDSRYGRIRDQFIRSYARFIAKSDFDLYDDLCYHSENPKMYYSIGARSIHLIKEKVALHQHKRNFKKIKEELIASAMKPCRIEAQLNHFDNIEDFFESMGC